MNHRFYILLALLLGTMQGINAAVIGGALATVETATFGKGDVHAIKWLLRNGINYVAYAGYISDGGKDEVRLGSFNANTVDFDLKYKKQFSYDNSVVHSLDWLDAGAAGDYLAAGGFTNSQGKEIAVFRFVEGSSFQREVRTNFNSTNNNVEVFAVKWFSIGGVFYLFVGGNDDRGNKEIRTYKLDVTVPADPTLTEVTSASATFTHGEVRSLDTVTMLVNDEETTFVVAGGNEIGGSEIKIYQFDEITETLILTATESMNSGTAYAVRFFTFDGNVYLAVGGNDAGEDQEIRIFEFDGEFLDLVATASFNNGIVYSLSWVELDDNVYLVAGGDDGNSENLDEKRVYWFDGGATLIELTNASLNGGAVYATEFQTIDDKLYIAEGGDAQDPTEVQRPFRIEQFIPVISSLT
jgi:WD40 repeat protein